MEEEPSEIFIWREIPFDLELVGALVADIRDCIGTDHTHSVCPPGHLPELRVTKLDDVTSCLSLLKNCVTSWVQDISRRTGQLVDENKLFKVQ